MQNLFGSNIFLELHSSDAGDSIIVDLIKDGIAQKFSFHAVYTVSSLTKATYEDENCSIEADVGGIAGNVTLEADSESTITELVAVWNLANEANELTLTGDGSAIPTEDIVLSGGIDAVSGCSIKLQKSNDGINWIDVASATSISDSGQVMIENTNVSFRYLKAVKALSAGEVEIVGNLLVLGQ